MTFDDVKEELRRRCDVVDVINSYVPLKKAGANHKACCPFHNEKTPSFNVSSAKQMYYCFGCHKGGDIFSFVQEFEGVDFLGAIRILAGFAGMPVDIDELRRGDRQSPAQYQQQKDRKDLLYEIHDRAAHWYQQNLRSDAGREAREYLGRRGLTDDQLVAFGLGYAPEGWTATREWGHRQGYNDDLLLASGLIKPGQEDDPQSRLYDRFRHRIMFPIWDPQGRVIAFSGRALKADDPAKYLNSPTTALFEKSQVLYAFPQARRAIREQDCAILCEGQLDVIACHRAGLTHAVAPQGTAFTESQARLLKRHANHLIVCFDADNAGINAALKSIHAFLPAGLTARVVLLDQGEDPDSLLRHHGPEALAQRFAQAIDFFDFLLDRLSDLHGLDTADGKAQVSAAYIEAVALLPSPVLRAEYCQRLAVRLRLPEESVFQELNRIVNQQLRASRYRRDEPGAPPRPAASAEQPAVTVSPEAVLLDIALHHEAYAHRLAEELPHDHIADSPIGLALNVVLAHTQMGEWEEVADFLREQGLAEPSPELSRILIEPQFGPGTEPKVLDKAYTDSRNKLVDAWFGRRDAELNAQLAQAQQRDERNAIFRAILELKQQQKSWKPASHAHPV